MSTAFVPDPRAWYVLTFEHSGHAVSVAGASTDEGANVEQGRADGLPSQSWRFEPVEDGWYLVIARHSGHALSLAEASADNKVNVQQAAVHRGEDQQWSLTEDQGHYVLRSRLSGKCLAAAGASQDIGGNVQQAGQEPKPQRRVALTPVLVPEPGAWYLLTFEHSGLPLTAQATENDYPNVLQAVDIGERQQLWTFEAVEPGWYMVRDRRNDKVLQVGWTSTDEGVTVQQAAAKGHEGQHWCLHTDAGGSICLRNRKSVRCLGVVEARTDQANVEQQGFEPQEHRRLRCQQIVEPRADTYHVLRFAHSGKALTATPDDGVEQRGHDGRPQQQWLLERVRHSFWRLRARHTNAVLTAASDDALALCDPSPTDHAQHWRFVVSGAGACAVSRTSGRCIEVAYGHTSSAATVQHRGQPGKAHRRLALSALPDAVAFTPEPGAWYTLTFAHSGKVLDVHGWSQDDGGNVIQYTNYENGNQLFTFEQVEDGWYLVRARHSGKVLDVAGRSIDDGANVLQWSEHGGANQQWRFVPAGDAYAMIARHSSRGLDVSARALDDRTNVQQQGTGEGQHQRVHITRAAGPLPEVAPRALKVRAGDEPIRLPPVRLTSKGDMTFEAWVRPLHDTGSDTIFEFTRANYDGSTVIRREGKDLRLLLHWLGEGNDADMGIGKAAGVLSAGQWAHVAVTLDQSEYGARERHMKIYVNAQLVAENKSTRGTSSTYPRIYDQCTLGGNRDGTEVFLGRMAEVRLWRRALDESTIEARWMNRVRGDEPFLVACYRLDAKVGGQMLDISAARAHAVAGAGATVGVARALPLPPTTGAGFRVQTTLTRQWLPQAAFDQAIRDEVARGYGDLSGIDSLEVSDIGPVAQGRVEASVYEVVLEPHDADGTARGDSLVRVDLDADRIVVVDDDGGEPHLEVWREGRHALRVPASGQIRLRLVATGPTCAGLLMRHAGMADDVFTRVFPDAANFSSMLSISGDALAQPADGRASPLPAGATAEDAESLAHLVNRLARVGAPLEALATQGVGGGGFWKDVEELFKDISDAVEDAAEQAEQVVEEVWTSTAPARELLASSVDDLIEEAMKVEPRAGLTAIRAHISQASSLEVVISAVDELAGVVQFVGSIDIGGVTKYWRIVIDRVEDAMTAMVALFKRVGASIKDFIDMLASSLDWGRFLSASDDIYDTTIGALVSAKAAIDQERAKDQFAIVNAQLADLRAWPTPDTSFVGMFEGDLPKLPKLDEVDVVLDYLRKILSAAELELPMPHLELPMVRWVEQWTETIEQALPDMSILEGDIADLMMGDLNQRMLALWDHLGSELLGNGGLYDELLEISADAVDGIRQLLEKRIVVPWYTDVIEQTVLAGRPLNLLRVVSLLGAIPAIGTKSGSRPVSFGITDTWALTVGAIGCAGSLLGTMRCVNNLGVTDNIFGAWLAMIHGTVVTIQGCLEAGLGAAEADWLLVSGGTVNFAYGVLQLGCGEKARESIIGGAGKVDEATETLIDSASIIGDVLAGTAMIGLGVGKAFESKGADSLLGWVEGSGYWVGTWVLYGAGRWAKHIPGAGRTAQGLISLAAVGLNGYYAWTAAEDLFL